MYNIRSLLLLLLFVNSLLMIQESAAGSVPNAGKQHQGASPAVLRFLSNRMLTRQQTVFIDHLLAGQVELRVR